MILGFTGTGKGMTRRQADTVRRLFAELRLTVLHHGDCVGADAEAHQIANRLGILIVGHPPLDPKARAFCDYSLPDVLLPPKPYLDRNRDIVAAAEGIIAAPKTYFWPVNFRNQGTWTTARYARQAGKRLWLAFPDGTCREEGQLAACPSCGSRGFKPATGTTVLGESFGGCEFCTNEDGRALV